MLNPTNLVFNSITHTYYVDNEQYTGVTTFIKKFERPFLTEYIATMYAGKHGLEVNDVITMWEKKRIDAARAGSLVHSTLENFINDGVIENEVLINNFIECCNNSLIKKNDYFLTEARVCSPTNKLAGTFDLAGFTNCGSYDLYDFKTGDVMKSGYGKMLPPVSHLSDSKINKYSLQLQIYSSIINECGYTCRSKSIVWIKDDFSIEVIPVNDFSNEVNDLFAYEKEDSKRRREGYIAHLFSD